MKVALAQMKITADIKANYLNSIRLLETAASHKADLIVFPEIQLSPFFPQYPKKDVSQYVLKPNNAYIHGFCQACRDNGIYASPNLYIEENGKRYDMSLLIDDAGSIIGTQKMVHISQSEHFYEQDYYSTSEDGFAVFDTKFGKIGIVVCFDRHYPESIRTETLRGAELILIPTANTTIEPSEMFQWEIKVQAFQNSVNIVMCNRTGTEGEMMFAGESIVCDYNGQTISFAGRDEILLIADVDLHGASKTRKAKQYMSLSRIELYE